MFGNEDPFSLVLRPGDTYADYEVLQHIETGGFAAVYRVKTPRLDVPAALKLSLRTVADTATAQRAIREIAILKSLRSPHAVRIYEGGMRPDGHVFLLLEYLEGMQLNRWHDFDDPLDVETTLEIVRQVCIGLCEAHAVGIVHRDLKPENIWILPEGRVKVLDFGLARTWAGTGAASINATGSRMLVGTPHYSQPEQLKSARLTPAADVYTLATLIYELLTGRSVFIEDIALSVIVERLRDQPQRWIGHHATDQVVPLTRYRADVPAPVVDLLHRALDKEPSHRPANATEFSVELTTLLDGMRGTQGRLVTLIHPSGRIATRPFAPGTFRIGAAPSCEIRLVGPGPEVDAIIDWWGEGTPTLRRISGKRSVAIGDAEIETDAPIELAWEAPVRIGDWQIQVA